MGYLARAFEYYKGEPHQREAVAKLEGMVDPQIIEAFRRVFSPVPSKASILQVPFFSQLDNLRMAHRTCNPSSCAMCLEYFNPGAIESDDDLVEEFIRRGVDVTNHQQMTIILRSFGLQSVFRYDLTKAGLLSELECKRPVVMGILHRGPATMPRGGHMVVAVGYDDASDELVVHDPYGSLLSGYAGPAVEGRFVRYPWAEISPRWLVEGPSSGWGRVFLNHQKETPHGHHRAA